MWNLKKKAHRYRCREQTGGYQRQVVQMGEMGEKGSEELACTWPLFGSERVRGRDEEVSTALAFQMISSTKYKAKLQQKQKVKENSKLLECYT